MKWKSLIRSIFAFLAITSITSCDPDPSANPNPTPVSPGVSFAVVQSTDTIIKIRVSWRQAQDAYGPAEYYLHTMTSSKLVTDGTTGPLPTLKQVNGLVDTVRIRISMVNDTVTLISNVWSYRRGLRSTLPATGRLFVRRGDVPPLPPDSLTVDTLVIGMNFGGPGLTYSICCGPAGGGPWLDTIEVHRLYIKNPGVPYVGLFDYVLPDNRLGSDTVVVVTYSSPLLTFRFSRPNIVTFAVDSHTAVFKTVTTGQYVYIIANYAGRIDSMRIYAGDGGYCGPWPDCYYNPQLYAPQMPELPRVYIDIPPYEPLPSPPPASALRQYRETLKIAE